MVSDSNSHWDIINKYHCVTQWKHSVTLWHKKLVWQNVKNLVKKIIIAKNRLGVGEQKY